MSTSDTKTQPRGSAAYAALSETPRGASAAREDEALPLSEDQVFFATELGRIDVIMKELWTAFNADTCHMPSPTVYFANAYLDAVSLRLRLMANREPRRLPTAAQKFADLRQGKAPR